MAVDDRTRLNLHRKLEAVLGPEEADTLMAHLPPVTWHDVATKDDLRATESVLRSELRTGMAGLRTGLADIRSELHQAIDRQTRWMVTFICAWSTVIVAATRLLF